MHATWLNRYKEQLSSSDRDIFIKALGDYTSFITSDSEASLISQASFFVVTRHLYWNCTHWILFVPVFEHAIKVLNKEEKTNLKVEDFTKIDDCQYKFQIIPDYPETNYWLFREMKFDKLEPIFKFLE